MEFFTDFTKSTNLLVEGILLERAGARFDKMPIGGIFYATFNVSNLGSPFLVTTTGDKYSVYTFKKNQIVSSRNMKVWADSNNPEKAMLEATKEIFKKAHRNLDAKKFIDLAVKEKLHFGMIYQWFPHLKGSDAISDTPIGKFKIVGEVSDDQLSKLKKIVNGTEKMLTKHGYSHLLYGSLTVGGKIQGNVLANYVVEGDHISFNPKKIDGSDRNVQTLIHELGHRQWYQFKTDKKAVSIKMLETNTNAKKDLKIGTELIFHSEKQKEFDGGLAVITSIKKKQASVRLFKKGENIQEPIKYSKGMLLKYNNIYDKTKMGNKAEVSKGGINRIQVKIYGNSGNERDYSTMVMSISEMYKFFLMPDGSELQSKGYMEADVTMGQLERDFTFINGSKIFDSNLFRVSDYSMTAVTEFFPELFAHGFMRKMEPVIQFVKDIAKK